MRLPPAIRHAEHSEYYQHTYAFEAYVLQIETVDKYQGSQNDYVLVSLVRTKHVGHLRDVRRLIVALSRARLGLYIFCR